MKGWTYFFFRFGIWCIGFGILILLGWTGAIGDPGDLGWGWGIAGLIFLGGGVAMFSRSKR